MGTSFAYLLFNASLLASPFFAAAGIVNSSRSYLWIAALLSTPLVLYAGLGGNDLAAGLLLLTPLLLLSAGYTRGRGVSVTLAIVAFLFPAWLMIPIWF